MDVTLAGGLTLGVVIRVLVARSSLGRPNSDEAVAMLMAKKAAYGHFHSLYWGGNYGGALSAVVEAPFVRIFGTNVLLYRFINGCTALACALLVGWIAGQLLGPATGRLATVIFWLLPIVWIQQSIQEYEFYVPGLLVALATVALCLRSSDRGSDKWLWGLGLAAGLAFWAFPLLGCIVIPAVVAKVWTLRRHPRAILASLALAPLGAAPWIYTTVATHFATLHPTVGTGVPFSDRVGRAVTVVLPAAVVFGIHLEVLSHPRPLAVTGVLIVVVAVGLAAWSLRWGRGRLALITLPLLIWPFLLGASKVYEDAQTFRYGLMVIPTLSILAAWVIHGLRPIVVTAIVAVAVSVTILNLSSSSAHFRVVPRFDPGITTLGTYLTGAGRTHVFATYWTAYVLTIETDERVTADPVVVSRYPPYRTAAERSPESTYVFQLGNGNDRTLSQWLAGHGGGRRVVVGPYAVFLFDHRVPVEGLPNFEMEAS